MTLTLPHYKQIYLPNSNILRHVFCSLKHEPSHNTNTYMVEAIITVTSHRLIVIVQEPTLMEETSLFSCGKPVSEVQFGQLVMNKFCIASKIQLYFLISLN